MCLLESTPIYETKTSTMSTHWSGKKVAVNVFPLTNCQHCIHRCAGRETVFTTASMFLYKISSGAVGMMRTRDLMNMNSGVNILTRFSTFCGGTSFFFSLTLGYIALLLYAGIFFLLSATEKDLRILQIKEDVEQEVEKLNRVLDPAAILIFSLSTAIPFLAEQLLERGLFGVWLWVKELPASCAFYLFQVGASITLSRVGSL